ncbi:MAG: hypothetical protein KDI62_19950 [Anaerolineae bacterium]|nr:hypothetical protein [Anaerolineae bacterium]MCB0180514.1 hypothetical protein [Anaerolineae bacterium]MCB9109232.1 hypothetical protein [Anaerolineales bacterium]
MTQSNPKKALFANLVYDEDGNPVETTFIGQDPFYVILDGDFRRHVAAEEIDRQVVHWLTEQISANKDLVSEGVMNFIGKDDLFTKAMVDSSINRMDELMNQGMPDDARMMLGMMGFKVIVNYHGELVKLDMPAQEFPDEE